jgi:transcription initiation factor TFIID subunit 5
MFLHTHLQLVDLGAAPEARSLDAAHVQRFFTAGAARSGREQALRELLSLSTPEQLASSPCARAVRATRSPMRISQYAYDMLTMQLCGRRLLLMLAVMNRWLALEVVDAPVAGAAAAEEDAAVLGGAAAEVDADTINQTPLLLKRLQDGVEQHYAKRTAATEEAGAVERAADEKLTKKQRAVQQREAVKAKSRRESVEADCMAAEFPLPPIPEERKAALLEEIRARETAGAGGKPVSPAALPSAAFFTFVNTQQSLTCVALSADASRVAGGFDDSSLRVYDVRASPGGRAAAAGAAGTSASAQVDAGLLHFSGHSGAVYAADFSPDDQLLLSSSADGTVRLWSMELRVALAAYKGHVLPVWDASFAPDYGYYFASGGADRAARVWSTERSQALRVFAGHQGDVDVVRWHPNCHYLATGSSDCTVRLWDLRGGVCARVLGGQDAGQGAAVRLRRQPLLRAQFVSVAASCGEFTRVVCVASRADHVAGLLARRRHAGGRRRRRRALCVGPAVGAAAGGTQGARGAGVVPSV